MLAFAAMSMFHGPLSDAVGRRPVIVGSLAGVRRRVAWRVRSADLELLLVGRVVQGLAAGGSTIVSRTIIRDLFDGARRSG